MNMRKNKKTVKSTKITAFSLAGVEGFEPSQAVLETDVLPLTLYSYKNYLNIIT